jgi:hypothetical protein
VCGVRALARAGLGIGVFFLAARHSGEREEGVGKCGVEDGMVVLGGSGGVRVADGGTLNSQSEVERRVLVRLRRNKAAVALVRGLVWV